MLESSLTVAADADRVDFTLRVTNVETEPVSLSFRNSQRAEFVVRDGDREVWRWSDGQMFAQMLGSEELQPDEEKRFEATWDAPESGSYTVVGELVDEDSDAAAEAEFSV